MTVRRARLLVVLSGAVVLAAVALGFAVVGGPDTGRRDRRDATRLSDLREIAEALACHREAKAEPAEPTVVTEVTPACLAPDAAARLADPATRAPYRIAHLGPNQATVCADFESALPDFRAAGWPPFDPATGCITVNLAHD